MEISAPVLTRIYDKIQDHDISGLNRLLAMAVSISIALLFCYQLRNTWLTFNYQPEQSVTVESAKPTSSYIATNITKNNVFGRSLASSDTEANRIPATRLQLKLRGAFTSSNPKNASAIIEGSDGKTQTYKLGSRIYGQASLHQVLADRIVLSRDGELENLYFSEPDTTDQNSQLTISNSSEPTNLSAYANQIPADIKQLVQDNMSLTEIQQASKQLQNSAMTPQQRKELISKRLQELRKRARTNK
jgi:general secretion pathway protein C